MSRTLEQRASDASEYIIDEIAACVDMAQLGWTRYADELQADVYSLVVQAAHAGGRVLDQRDGLRGIF